MSWNPLMLEAQTKAHIGYPTQTSEAQYGARGRTFLDQPYSSADVMTIGFPFTHSPVI